MLTAFTQNNIGIYRFNAIPIKMPVIFFTEKEQIILKCLETNENSNSQSNLEKKGRAEWNMLPDFRWYYIAAIIKATWYWHKTDT